MQEQIGNTALTLEQHDRNRRKRVTDEPNTLPKRHRPSPAFEHFLLRQRWRRLAEDPHGNARDGNPNCAADRGHESMRDASIGDEGRANKPPEATGPDNCVVHETVG